MYRENPLSSNHEQQATDAYLSYALNISSIARKDIDDNIMS